jgi:hypothetical protein
MRGSAYQTSSHHAASSSDSAMPTPCRLSVSWSTVRAPMMAQVTLGWAKEPLVALGYALFAVVCLVLGGRKAAPA